MTGTASSVAAQALGKVVGISGLRSDTPLCSLGLDPVAIVAWADVANELGAQVNNAALREIRVDGQRTVADLAACLDMGSVQQR